LCRNLVTPRDVLCERSRQERACSRAIPQAPCRLRRVGALLPRSRRWEPPEIAGRGLLAGCGGPRCPRAPPGGPCKRQPCSVGAGRGGKGLMPRRARRPAHHRANEFQGCAALRSVPPGCRPAALQVADHALAARCMRPARPHAFACTCGRLAHRTPDCRHPFPTPSPIRPASAL
jgi:hypothetical protein